MKKIIFHGCLKAFCKKGYRTFANTWEEINQSMQANLSNYSIVRQKLINDVKFVHFIVDGAPVDHKEDLNNMIKNSKKIEVIPVVVQQGFSAVFAFIAKLILTFAISFAISYLMSKLLTPKDPKQVKTSSYIINAKTNRATRNDPVPVGYGRIRIAPNTISNLTFNIDLVDVVRGRNVLI